jgi:hypothetical protein
LYAILMLCLFYMVNYMNILASFKKGHIILALSSMSILDL